jgi:hypothetical protein
MHWTLSLVAGALLWPGVPAQEQEQDAEQAAARAQLTQAKTVAFLLEAPEEKPRQVERLRGQAEKALDQWGRLKRVADAEQADLIFSVTHRKVYGGEARGPTMYTSRPMMLPVTEVEVYAGGRKDWALQVPLWRHTEKGRYESSNTLAGAVKKFREDVEAAAER